MQLPNAVPILARSIFRLAAVQATVGSAWPVTTGIPAIDYFITFDAEVIFFVQTFSVPQADHRDSDTNHDFPL